MDLIPFGHVCQNCICVYSRTKGHSRGRSASHILDIIVTHNGLLGIDIPSLLAPPQAPETSRTTGVPPEGSLKQQICQGRFEAWVSQMKHPGGKMDL